MSISEAGANSQKDISDEEYAVSFVTIEEKDTHFSSKSYIEREGEERTN